MSGEDPEDKKVENPAADDDSIDDDSLDDVFEVDETFDVDGEFEVDPEAAEALATMAEASEWQVEKRQSTANARSNPVGFDTLS